MSRIAPLLVRLFFIFAFVYAWYLITSSRSDDSSVLLSDENSDRQVQAIHSKLEDDKMVPISKNVPTVASGILNTKTERTPLKSGRKNVVQNVQEHISLEEMSDHKLQLLADKNREQERLELRKTEVTSNEGLNVQFNMLNISNSDLDGPEQNNGNTNPNRQPDAKSQNQSSFSKHSKNKFIFNNSDDRNLADSGMVETERKDSLPTESDQEITDSQILASNDGEPNFFRNIWNKFVEPSTAEGDTYAGGKGKCPPGDVLTIIGGGRLANCIWEYATVRSLSRFLPGRRTPYVQKFIIDSLADVFENLSLPIVEDIPKQCKCCESVNWYEKNIQIYSFIPLRNIKQRFRNVPGNLILPKYSLLIEPVIAERNNLIREMRFKPEVHEAAIATIKKNTEVFYNNNNVGDAKITYVGVHVRRSDYIDYLNSHYNLSEATPQYYITAMDYFRLQRPDLGKPVFFIVTDDVPWVQENLLGKSDVFSVSFGGIDTPGHDLAVLCYCNHSIIDYGTFGLWAAVYAGGETISIKTSNQVYQILGKEKNWHFAHLDGAKPEIW